MLLLRAVQVPLILVVLVMAGPSPIHGYDVVKDPAIQRQVLFDSHLRIALQNRHEWLHRQDRPMLDRNQLSSVVTIHLIGRPPAFMDESLVQVDPACASTCRLTSTGTTTSSSDLLPKQAVASETETPHVVLSPDWLDWTHAQLIHDHNLNMDPGDAPLPQLHGTVSGGEFMLRASLAEDLSKMSLLVHWSSASDVRVLDFSVRELNTVAKAVGQTMRSRASESLTRQPLHLEIVGSCMGVDPDEAPWFVQYLQELGRRVRLFSNSDSCSPFVSNSTLTQETRPRIQLTIDKWLVGERLDPDLLKTIRQAHVSSTLVLHLGVGEGLGASAVVKRQLRSFPARHATAITLQDVSPLNSAEKTIHRVWLPRWHVIPFDAFPSVHTLADYLAFINSNPNAYAWHFPTDGDELGTRHDLQQWARDRRRFAWDARGDDAWTCRVCKHFRERMYVH